MLAAGAPPAAGVPPTVPSERTRIEEIVVTVSDLRRLERAFGEVMGWRVMWRGTSGRDAGQRWGGTAPAAGRQVLMGSPSSAYGRIRFVEVRGGRAPPMRPAGKWWDTGGAYAINVFVSDAVAVEAGLRTLGWVTAQPLRSYAERDGDRVVARGRFGRMIGPDDLVVGFQERQDPPLQRWPAFTGASHVENVMEPVSDLDGWSKTAAAALGAEPPRPVVRDISRRPGDAAVYGLPAAVAGEARAEQAILRIGAAGEQMLTAWRFGALRGEDHSKRIDGSHLGVLAIRVRVPDAAVAATRLGQASIAPLAPFGQYRLPPYGAIASVSVRAGGGSGIVLEMFSVVPARDAD